MARANPPPGSATCFVTPWEAGCCVEIQTCMYTYKYIYIYIERERVKDRYVYKIYTIYVYKYIYIYISCNSLFTVIRFDIDIHMYNL